MRPDDPLEELKLTTARLMEERPYFCAAFGIAFILSVSAGIIL